LRSPGRSSTRIRAVVAIRVEDYFPNGKRHKMPAHHKLEQFLDEYLEAAGTGDHDKIPLSAAARTGTLTDRTMHRVHAYAMVCRRTAEAGLKGKLGCHVFRATGIAAYLQASGTLENARAMAAHESPRTAKLYYRTSDEITLDEVERITISRVLANPT
jgi:integrase